ncbi:unnamed protein product [Pleuronectes platessa]|uniref:F-box domain-containing protein n=1 Tax=Pleuronectes platessa TaxID=8262 RepID=A0A9N7YFB1_PLEPL|nr:unnamed protein product [Pleuronectes platessa]
MDTHQTTGKARAVSEHLEDAGNCRHNINQEPNLCCSLLSEQKKLRHVLDWAHRFLSSGSELHRELCTADSLILATEKDEAKRENISYKINGAQSKGVMSDNQKEVKKQVKEMSEGEEEKRDAGLEEEDGNKKQGTYSAFLEFAIDHMSHREIPCHLKTPSDLTVYEQYQLCVDRLHRLRLRPRIEAGCFADSPARGKMTCEETAAPARPPTRSKFNSSTANPEIKKYFSEATTKTEDLCKNKDRTESNGLTKHKETKHHDNLTLRKNRGLCQTSSVYCNKHGDFKKRPAGAKTSTDKPVDVHVEDSTGEERAAPPANSDTSAHGGSTDYKHTVAAVPACGRWLRLPDEVWLSVLSLLPHTDLCRVMQVCRRLLTLATDHTLWKHLRIENSMLTEQRLLFWGKCRPRSLCLSSCSGPSMTSHGLQVFFTLCKNHLEDVKVIGCTGPGLHGDQILPQIGQLCDHVTSVDMSWSGATDMGVKALSDGRAGLRLKSVVLNGCHVTDDPLKKLVMRHRERLEVFGCQFLTASCLQTIYEICPGLKHLNIGQVPKVNAHSLTVMASQLKCLISLNVTGLQAVTDVTVATLLQNYVELESLTLSSCPGVTDLTLHNISKYTPCIRYLDVSGCGAVTSAGVQSLTLGCRRLQQLDLSSTGAGNRGVSLLANYCSKHLQTVKLSFCHITSENILKLCRRSKRLKLLQLYGCVHLPSEREIREVNAMVKVYPLS